MAYLDVKNVYKSSNNLFLSRADSPNHVNFCIFLGRQNVSYDSMLFWSSGCQTPSNFKNSRKNVTKIHFSFGSLHFIMQACTKYTSKGQETAWIGLSSNLHVSNFIFEISNLKCCCWFISLNRHHHCQKSSHALSKCAKYLLKLKACVCPTTYDWLAGSSCQKLSLHCFFLCPNYHRKIDIHKLLTLKLKPFDDIESSIISNIEWMRDINSYSIIVWRF